MDEAERLSALIELIHDAGLAPERWSDAVAAISGELDAAAGALIYYDRTAFGQGMAHGIGFGYSDAEVAAYEALCGSRYPVSLCGRSEARRCLRRRRPVPLRRGHAQRDIQ